jgi:NTE family protein
MRAIVLSGGGARGAFQVGALRHLLGAKRNRYDIICGTSVGALNGAFLAQYQVGQEPEAARGLEDLWRSLKGNGSIYRRWYWGLLGRLPAVLPRWAGGRLSAYSSKPLRHLVRTRLSPRRVQESGRILRVGAVDLVTGERKVWTEQDGPRLWDGVLASSSFPVMLEPVRIGSALYTDDGVRDITPIGEAILAGATEIDAIACSPLGVPPHKPKTGLDVLERCLMAMSDEIDRQDFDVVELYNGLVRTGQAPGKREITLRVLRPREPVLESGLDFDPRKIRANIELGFEAAKGTAW